METDPKDFWMTLKASWIPQPRWLSAEVGESATGTTPIVPAPIQHRRQGEPDYIMPFDGCLGHASEEAATPHIKEKRKNHREFGVNRSARAERALSIKRMENDPIGEQGIGYLRPAREMASPLKLRNRKRKIHDNVVELRPRLRDEIYASKILDALCKACEAHAAGEDELLMVRIKILYHMFDGVVR